MILLLDVMGTLVYEPFHTELPAFFGMTLEELYAAKHPTAWITEGLPLYMELLEKTVGEKDERVFRFGQFVDDDLQNGLAAHSSGELMDLDDFVHIEAYLFGAACQQADPPAASFEFGDDFNTQMARATGNQDSFHDAS